MAHKDIRVPFTVDGRNYEAVGFLNEGESPVSGDEMLKRTAGKNGGAIGGWDEEFLSKRLIKFPKELCPYVLVIGHTRHRNYLQIVLHLGFNYSRYVGWDFPDYP